MVRYLKRGRLSKRDRRKKTEEKGRMKKRDGRKEGERRKEGKLNVIHEKMFLRI